MTALVLVALLLATPDAAEPVGELPRPDWSLEFQPPPAADPAQARETAAALQAEMDAEAAVDAVLSDPAQQRVVVSAMLCEARGRQRDTEAALARGLSKPLARAAIRAAQDVTAAETRLLVLGIVPMSCGHRDVERLVDCLSPAPETWCSLNTQIAVLVRAAEKLTEEVR